ncbi:hypothetical protein B5S28_g1116 [[Candida] boidinii]|nr:hypothetical protein B5S28_g1116 [[Candida] boidinii]OWB79280.1 hypothetical protein B5S32_g3495 [[Candida] boidinii]
MPPKRKSASASNAGPSPLTQSPRSKRLRAEVNGTENTNPNIFETVLNLLYDLKDEDEPERDIATEFLKLPSKKLYPDYYELIESPISINEIKNKVTGKKYLSNDDFLKDFKLMSSNASTFNDPDSDIAVDCNVIYKFVESKLKEIQLQQEKAAEIELTRPQKTPKVILKSPKLEKTSETQVAKKSDFASKDFSSSLQQVWKAVVDFKVRRVQFALPFMDLVDGEEYPDYYTVVEKGMAFNEVKNKIQAGQYKNGIDGVEAFKSDILLIIQNAKTYNEEDSLIYKHANILLGQFEKKFKSFTEDQNIGQFFGYQTSDNNKQSDSSIKIKLKQSSAEPQSKVTLNLKLKGSGVSATADDDSSKRKRKKKVVFADSGKTESNSTEDNANDDDDAVRGRRARRATRKPVIQNTSIDEEDDDEDENVDDDSQLANTDIDQKNDQTEGDTNGNNQMGGINSQVADGSVIGSGTDFLPVLKQEPAFFSRPQFIRSHLSKKHSYQAYIQEVALITSIDTAYYGSVERTGRSQFFEYIFKTSNDSRRAVYSVNLQQNSETIVIVASLNSTLRGKPYVSNLVVNGETISSLPLIPTLPYEVEELINESTENNDNSNSDTRDSVDENKTNENSDLKSDSYPKAKKFLSSKYELKLDNGLNFVEFICSVPPELPIDPVSGLPVTPAMGVTPESCITEKIGVWVTVSRP